MLENLGVRDSVGNGQFIDEEIVKFKRWRIHMYIRHFGYFTKVALNFNSCSQQKHDAGHGCKKMVYYKREV